jgi:cyclopropane fatty-acyl-phospholipid synthase-like methyltransferase
MSQQVFWNNKFSKVDYFYGTKPNEFLASKIDLIKDKKTLLCLGEGEGRNAIFFAQNGLKITAIDASDVGLAKLESKSKEENLEITTIFMDLNHWEAKEKYDVIMASYLHMYNNEREELFKKVENSLNKGGYFIGEFFSKKQLSYESGGPKDLDLLYSTEDFSRSFLNCEKNVTEEIVTLDEGIGHKGEACVIRVVIKKI